MHAAAAAEREAAGDQPRREEIAGVAVHDGLAAAHAIGEAMPSVAAHDEFARRACRRGCQAAPRRRSHRHRLRSRGARRSSRSRPDRAPIRSRAAARPASARRARHPRSRRPATCRRRGRRRCGRSASSRPRARAFRRRQRPSELCGTARRWRSSRCRGAAAVSRCSSHRAQPGRSATRRGSRCASAAVERASTSTRSRQQLPEVKQERPELAAVVAGRDAQHARREAARDDRVDARPSSRRRPPPSVRPSMTISSTQRISRVSSLSATRPASVGQNASIRRGRQARVLAADLRARAHDAARKRQDHVAQPAHRCRGGFGAGERRVDITREQQQVAAADRLHDGRAFPRRRIRRPSPARASSACRRSSSRSASRRRRSAGSSPAAPARPSVEAGEHGGRRARQHALADAPFDLLGQFLARHREDQQRDAGSAVGRLVAGELGVRCRPRSRRRSPRSRSRSRESAACIAHCDVVRGDDEARRLHRERFGEGVVDDDVVAARMTQTTHLAPATAGRHCRRRRTRRAR